MGLLFRSKGTVFDASISTFDFVEFERVTNFGFDKKLNEEVPFKRSSSKLLI